MKKYKLRGKLYSKHSSTPTRREDELPVYGNLVVTPAQMQKMTEKGIPISAQNLSMTPQDGQPNPSWDLPLDQLRGIDPAQMWEESQIIKQRAKRAHDNDRKRFGDGELQNK